MTKTKKDLQEVQKRRGMRISELLKNRGAKYERADEESEGSLCKETSGDNNSSSE